ncbi:MAG: hypothetical protein [Circular genetic element sp.]|nr:MAG: hypothetical protein [Circular genetic element sp.]
MLKAKLSDGTPLMHYFRDQTPSFWKGTEFKNFRDFESLIIDKEKGTLPYYWIQFPKPHNLSTPQLFLDKILGLERYIWFKNYVFNVEFNPHIHCHLIIKDPSNTCRPARIIDNISKHLGIPGNNVECKRQTHSLTNRINYVKGLKVPQHKQMLVEKDCVDRQNNNIDLYYNDAQSNQETESP